VSREELVKKMEHILQRKLTPEEHKFLTLTSQAFKQETNAKKRPKAKGQVA
jgi:hypothetical protein